MSSTDTTMPLAPTPDSNTPANATLSGDLLKACIHCGMCLPACPTYGITGNEAESPRGRLFLMHQFKQGKIDGPSQLAPHLDACLGCMACQTVCPSGVDYNHLLMDHRQQLAPMHKKGFVNFWSGWGKRFIKQVAFTQLLPKPNRLNLMAKSLQWYRKKLLPTPTGQRLHHWVVNSPARQWQWQLMPNVPDTVSTIKAGQRFGDPTHPLVALMTGCIMDTLYHRVHHATIAVLVANGYQVVIPEQTCCGALAHHAGEHDIALTLASQNMAFIAPLLPTLQHVVLNSAGCGAMLMDYAHLMASTGETKTQWGETAKAFSQKVIDVMVLLAQKPLTPPKQTVPFKVTYHGACHLHYAQRVGTQPIEVLLALPGIEFTPLNGFDRCCGSAGIYNIDQPEMSQALLDEKMDAITLTEADVILTGNPGCLVQLQAGIKLQEGVALQNHSTQEAPEKIADDSDTEEDTDEPETAPDQQVTRPIVLHPLEFLAYAYDVCDIPELKQLAQQLDIEREARAEAEAQIRNKLRRLL
jgi:glycolate oxidase iron-sulfur subunit